VIPNLLFDLDGTLTDPAPGITGCIRFALSEMGCPVQPEKDLQNCIGPPLWESLDGLLGHPPGEQVDRTLALYRQRFEADGMFENRVYEGIPDLLAGLGEAGGRLFVATSKPTVYARPILEHFSLAEFFLEFTAPSWMAPGAPNPNC
jgi:phosphoglycolate phosphatase